MIRPSTRSFITAVIILFVCMAMLVPVISIRQSHRLKATIAVVDSTQQVLREVQDIVTAAIENESGARGFVITGNDIFLDQVRESKQMLSEGYGNLMLLLEDYPLQSAKIDSLEKYILLRVKYSDSMVTIRRQGGISATIPIVEKGTGKYYSDQIKRVSDNIYTGQTSLLNERKRTTGRTLGNLTTILYAMLAAVVLLTAIVIRRIWKDIKTQKENELRFAKMLDASPDSTIISNQQGKIVMVNIQTERLFGYSRGNLIGKPVELLIPGHSPEARSKYRTEFTGDEHSKLQTQFELEAVGKDGAAFPVEVSLSPIKTKEGTLISASIRDISKRKQMEADLNKINAELEAFTYSVSHDLRAPLRAIIGFSTILEEDYTGKLDAEAQRITSVVKSNALRMGELIDDLLEFSRLGRQQISKSTVNMNSLVMEVVTDLTNLNPGSSIKWDISSLPDADADLNTIRQVWVNLLSNALKYSSRSDNPLVHIGFEMSTTETVFIVRDNGVGFDNKYRDKLFKVFQRLHSANDFEGTGVGLALVEKIISKHGGKVWAEGQAGVGATFYFSLPFIKQQTDNAKS